MKTHIFIFAACASLFGCPAPPTPNTDSGTDAGSDGGQDGGADAGNVPSDLDVVVLRLNDNGTQDLSFGNAGTAVLNFSETTGGSRDSLWGMARDSTGRLVLFGSSKASARTDTDRFVTRLLANGTIDPQFGTQGTHWLDVSNRSDNARHGMIQADGKIVSSGYTGLPTGALFADGGTQTVNHIVLLRLDSTGQPDTTFGTNGISTSMPLKPTDVSMLWGMAEAYAVGQQSGGQYVTTGYGRLAPSGTVNLVSMRYANTGTLDTSWGTNGVYELDLIGQDDRGRHLTVLNDNRVALVGSGISSTGNIDAMLTLLTANGSIDTSFNTTGYKLFSFGRPEEAFFASALSPTGSTLAAVGYRASPGNTAENDDAILTLIPVAVGAPAEVSKAVPLSVTGNDRFWAVAFDATGKIVACGHVNENGDTRMAVARFNSDGSLDTTFGNAGIALHNVKAKGSEETCRALVVQADGKIVIAGVAEH